MACSLLRAFSATSSDKAPAKRLARRPRHAQPVTLLRPLMLGLKGKASAPEEHLIGVDREPSISDEYLFNSDGYKTSLVKRRVNVNVFSCRGPDLPGGHREAPPWNQDESADCTRVAQNVFQIQNVPVAQVAKIASPNRSVKVHRQMQTRCFAQQISEK